MSSCSSWIAPRRQGILDLVGQARRHFPDGGHLFHTLDMLLHDAQFPFRPQDLLRQKAA
jgi:hypothetical protein